MGKNWTRITSRDNQQRMSPCKYSSVYCNCNSDVACNVDEVNEVDTSTNLIDESMK